MILTYILSNLNFIKSKKKFIFFFFSNRDCEIPLGGSMMLAKAIQ
jgi:hypothetical protein